MKKCTSSKISRDFTVRQIIKKSSESTTIDKNVTILIAGGGTAGHIEPALAVADALTAYGKNTGKKIRIVALGTPKGLENQLVPQRGYELALTNPIPLPRTISVDLVKLPWRMICSLMRVRRIIKREKVDIVVGFGGYVALSAYLAAGIPRRYPIVVHEANALPGLANRIGAKLTNCVLSATEYSAFGSQVVGIPVRSQIVQLNRLAVKPQARGKFHLPEHGPVLLVFGGSQGAQIINNTLTAALESLLGAGVSVLHAYGSKNTPITLREPNHYSGWYRAVPYIDDMVSAYAASDLVLARSGAMTVAEVSAVGLPAIYVPLAHGNGEQAKNAASAVSAGAAIIVHEKDLTAQLMTQLVKDIVFNNQYHEQMGVHTVDHAAAADKIAHIILEQIGQ